MKTEPGAPHEKIIEWVHALAALMAAATIWFWVQKADTVLPLAVITGFLATLAAALGVLPPRRGLDLIVASGMALMAAMMAAIIADVVRSL